MWPFSLPIDTMPETASTFAEKLDPLYATLWLLTIVFTVLVLSLVGIFAIRYRRGSLADRSRPVDHDTRIELVWSIIPMLLGLAVFVWAAKLYVEVYAQPPRNAKEVFIIGKQWMWHLQHMNGVRENNELHLPVGQPVKLTLISQDVIHAFYIPAFRIKRDVNPGRYTSVWFTPTKPGKYRLFCTEYCGTQHSLMGGWVYVMPRQEFQRWYETGGAEGGVSERGGTSAQGLGGMAVAGASLFQSQGCVSCHAGPGGPGRAPTLVGVFGKPQPLENGRSEIADEGYIRESILNPRAQIVRSYQPIMPVYQGLLSEEQVLQLTAYIKALGDPKGAAAKQLAAGNTGQEPAERSGIRSSANTQNVQADFIGERNPASSQQQRSPADTANIQNDFIQTRRP